MRNYFKYISVLSLLMFATISANSQEAQQKQYYTFDRISQINPWINSSNGAGLIYNSIGNRFSTIEAYFNSIDGDYRNYNQAKNITSFGGQTKSYAVLDKLYMYGKFGYDYKTRKDQAWLGTAMENMVINPMLDSIPGKNILETYSLEAKVGYKFSDLIGGGITFIYDAATAAKRVDGRNLNTYSNLVVSPGMNFTTDYINLGINFNYKNTVDQVSYNYYGEYKDKYLCTMEGLYMYTKYPITVSNMGYRRYQQSYYGGSFQAELKLGDFSFFNDFSVGYGHENDYEGNTIRRRYAYVNSTIIDYKGILRYDSDCMDNALSIKFNHREDLSYNVINNYEIVPGTINEWEYYERGSVLRYSSIYENLGAEYRGFIKKDGNNFFSVIDFALGYDYFKWKREHKVYPAEYRQEIKRNDIYGYVNKNFECGNSLIRVNINGGYSFGDGNMLEEVNPLTTGSLLMNRNLLESEYNFLTADNYRIGASVKYSYIFNKEKGNTANIALSYLYRKATKLKTDRNDFSVSISYNF